MSRKLKPHDLPTAQLAAIARRNLQKGDPKQALKDARQCFRDEPTPEHRALVEEAYVARAQSLLQLGMPVEARDTLAAALEFGVQSPALQDGLSRALIQAGMGQQALALTSGAPDQSRVRTQLVDQLVLSPGAVPHEVADLRCDAERVRQALTAIAAGRDAEALELLQAVPRQSPLAEWKLFARGLIAWYGGGAADVAANWQRLDPARRPARMAAVLQALRERSASPAESAPAPKPSPAPSLAEINLRQAVDRLEASLVDKQLLDGVRDLARQVQTGKWTHVARNLRVLRGALEKSGGDLAARVTEAIYPQAVAAAGVMLRQDEDSQVFDELHRVAHPPRLDPTWSRFKALAQERAFYPYEDIEGNWLQYIGSLPQIAVFSEAERKQVEALVSLRLARMYQDAYEHEGLHSLRHEDDSPDFQPDGCTPRRMADLCLRYFERAVQQCPELLDAHRELAAAARDQGRHELAIETLEKLLARFPDDVDSRLDLCRGLLIANRAEDALAHAVIAYRQRPLDTLAIDILSVAAADSARRLALAKRWDEGRATLRKAAEHGGTPAALLALNAAHAALETAAKAPEAAAARYALVPPAEQAAWWLARVYEAQRYKAPRAECARHTEAWQHALQGNAPAASLAMAVRVMDHYARWFDTDVAVQAKVLLAAFKRATKQAFSREDLTRVCAWLREHHAPAKVLSDFARLGRRQHPQAGEYLVLEAELSLQKRSCRLRQTAQLLEEARDLTEAENRPDKAAALAAIDELSAEIEDRMDREFGRSFPSSFANNFAAACRRMAQELGPLEGMSDEDREEFLENPMAFLGSGGMPDFPMPKPRAKKKPAAKPRPSSAGRTLFPLDAPHSPEDLP